MAINLPSKNVITVFCACVILLIGIGVANHILSPSQEVDQIAGDSEARKEAFTLVQDALVAETDSTMKELADSATSSGSGISSGTSTASLTATERFSRIIIDQYLAAKHEKGTLTDADIKAIAANVMKTPIPTPGAQVYTRADIRTYAATGPELHAYGNALVKAFESNLSPDVGREIYLVEDILESNDPKKAAKLDDVSAYYKRMIAATLAIRTPDILAGSVVDYVNSLSRLRLSIENMGKVLSDPILAVKGINQREGFAEAAIGNLKTIGAILKTHGISYKPAEDGAALMP